MSRSQDPRGQRLANARVGKSMSSHLHVPAAMAQLIGPEARFLPELTEEGILFRYVSGQEPFKFPELPGWVVGKTNDGGE